MNDIIVSIILIALIAGAVTYIYKAKKSGQKCIGCPHAKECGGSNCSGCRADKTKEK